MPHRVWTGQLRHGVTAPTCPVKLAGAATWATQGAVGLGGPVLRAHATKPNAPLVLAKDLWPIVDVAPQAA